MLMISFLTSLLATMPMGDALEEAVWASRHRGILLVLWLHALGVLLLGLYMGATSSLCVAGGASLALVAAIAWGSDLGLQSRPGEGMMFWFTIPEEASHSA